MKATEEIHVSEVIQILGDLGCNRSEITAIHLLQEYSIEYIRCVASTMREIGPPCTTKYFLETAKTFHKKKRPFTEHRKNYLK